MTNSLVTLLREFYDEFYDNPFICNYPSSAASMTLHLKSLSSILLDENDVSKHTPSPCRWRSRTLHALDIDANPLRVGDWDMNVDGFPLRPGFRGVTWSRQFGYYVSEASEMSSDSNEDKEDAILKQEYYLKQRNLDRNIDTFVALQRCCGEYDPIPEINYEASDDGSHTDCDPTPEADYGALDGGTHTDSDSDFAQQKGYDKHFEQMLEEYEMMMTYGEDYYY